MRWNCDILRVVRESFSHFIAYSQLSVFVPRQQKTVTLSDRLDSTILPLLQCTTRPRRGRREGEGRGEANYQRVNVIKEVRL